MIKIVQPLNNNVVMGYDRKKGEVIIIGTGIGFRAKKGDQVDESKIHRYFRMNLRNLRFVKHYPTEALCEPVFRTWFAGWKKIHGIR